jgi:uncharacterized NAD-dependent epimerase/dehydratase family protein
MAVLAEGRLSSIGLRMVIAALLYVPDRVVAVIDSTKTGQTTREAVGFGGETPIVANVQQAMERGADSMLIGITPLGGALPEDWRSIVREGIKGGLNIISGLLQPLANDQELARLAEKHGVEIIDLHKVPNSHLIRAQGSWRMRTVNTILTVGTDSSTGKLTTALLVYKEMLKRGMNAALIGTGVTGMVIGGRGVMLENVPSDFIVGALELEIDKAANDGHEYIIVDGHGAITNCGNSPIALGILHGAMPDAMIMCHEPSRATDCYGLALPDISFSIKLHENMMSLFKQSGVVAIGLNSMGLSKVELEAVQKDLLKRTGLVAVDPLRNGAVKLVDALVSHFATVQRTPMPADSVYINDRL